MSLVRIWVYLFIFGVGWVGVRVCERIVLIVGWIGRLVLSCIESKGLRVVVLMGVFVCVISLRM